MPALRRALAGALAALVLATAAQAQPPVWLVTDADSEMVLFGSVHLLPPQLAWKPAALEAALKSADDIWFENPVGDAADRESTKLALSLGTLPPGGSLFALLSRRDAARLQRLVVAYGLDIGLIDRLEPWLAEALIVQWVLAKDRGAYGDYGVEAAVGAASPPTAQRRWFATNAEHLALMDEAPRKDQIASLRDTLRAIERNRDEYPAMLRAWMAGDLSWLLRHQVEPGRRTAPAQFRRLVTQRNARWSQALDDRLKGKGRTVVIVGMGHMVGRDGLPARLRALGYSVKGP